MTEIEFRQDRFEKMLNFLDENRSKFEFDYTGMDTNSAGISCEIFPELLKNGDDFPSVDDCAEFFGLTEKESIIVFWDIGIVLRAHDIWPRDRFTDDVSLDDWLVGAHLFLAEKQIHIEKFGNTVECPDCGELVDKSVGLEAHRIMECKG